MSKNPVIACCLSLFIFPGAGHIYLGQKKVGWIIGLLCALILGAVVVQFELDLIRQVKQMTDPLAALSIRDTLVQNSWQRDKHLYMTGLVVFGVLWLGSAVDVFRKK